MSARDCWLCAEGSGAGGLGRDLNRSVAVHEGCHEPGGASGNLAPEIHEGIGSVGDGERVELDYSKNDVFAVSRPDPFGSSILL